MPANARYLPVSYSSSEHHNILTKKTKNCALGVCADRAMHIDAASPSAEQL